jgi:endonuclease/exonuclease/phosphatase family metal-dependent hydrolase
MTNRLSLVFFVFLFACGFSNDSILHSHFHSESETPEPITQISVLTYNVWGLPPLLGAKAQWRYGVIGKLINQWDIVGLQETWSEKTEDIFNHSEFSYVAKSDPDHKVLHRSGLITLSKFPIIETELLEYSECAGFDCFANKAALRTRIQISATKIIDVYNTHLNAFAKDLSGDIGARIRASQIWELSQWIHDRSSEIPFIIMGDFNADESTGNYDQMKNDFRAIDLFRIKNPVGKAATYDYQKNTWVGGLVGLVTGPTRLDYIWLGGASQYQIKDASLAFTEEYDPMKCLLDCRPKNLSDHFGVSVHFELF